MKQCERWKYEKVKYIEQMIELIERLQKRNNALIALMSRFQKLERKYKELEKRYHNLDRLFTASMLKRLENKNGKMGILEG